MTLAKTDLIITKFYIDRLVDDKYLYIYENIVEESQKVQKSVLKITI